MNGCLPPDENRYSEGDGEMNLTGDLTSPHYKWSSNGSVIVEGKDSLRKRIGRSTDDADAVIHALIGPVLQYELEQQGERYEITYDVPEIGRDW
jgi:hypothetical protein